MLARKGLVPEGFLLTRLAEDATQPNRFRTKSQRARFITKSGSCNVAHKNIREQVKQCNIYFHVIRFYFFKSEFNICHISAFLLLK